MAKEHTLGYTVTRTVTGILELENRCTGNRTVGSNPTLSAIFLAYAFGFARFSV